MKLSNLHSDPLNEWMLGKPQQYKDGYKDGVKGIMNRERYDKNAQYLRGWKVGYREYWCKQRPDLC